MHIAWFAGFFDGEGYIGVSHQRAWDCYMIRATVTNNSKEPVTMFADRFEGRISEPRHYGATAGKGSWTCAINGPYAIAMLRELRPHLVVKAPQADLAIGFPIGRPGVRVTAAAQDERRRIYRGLKELKGEVRDEPDGSTGDSIALDDDPRVAKAIALYEAGMNTTEVGQALGVHQSTISYWMRETGTARSRSEAHKQSWAGRTVESRPEAQEALRLYEADLSAADVARHMGRKPATVNYWLRKMGATRSLKDAQRLRRKKEFDHG